MVSRTFAAAGSLLALISASPAFAQANTTAASNPSPQGPNAVNPPNTQEPAIVVTAQLREQRQIDVPFALTAYTGRQIDQLGVQEFEDLARFTPGLSVQNQSPNNAAVNIRGITSDSGEASFESRISIYQDGVSISKPRGSYVELFDIDRVEISKGPQSTLYGRGALIGAINIVQAKPDLDEAYMMARGAYGNYNYWLGEAMVNVPLGSRVGLRIADRYKQRDGYVKNLLGGEDFQSVETGAIRGSLRFKPSNRVTADIIANWQKDTPSGTAFKSLRFRPTDPNTGAVLGGLGIRDGAALAPGAGFEGGKPLSLTRKVWGVSGLLKAELNDAFTLNSITAFRRFDALEILDIDGTSIPLITGADDSRDKQFSQELRLTWSNGGPVTAFVGANYFHEQGSQRTPVQFDERATLAQIAGALNGGGLIPGRPASDPAPLSVLANPMLDTLLLQGVAAAYGYALPALPASGSCNGLLPAASCIAANLKSIHRETQTNFSRTSAFDLFGDVSAKVSPQFEVGAGIRWTHDDKSSGVSASIQNGRSILGGFLGALTLNDPTRTALLSGLSSSLAPVLPTSLLPLFGLTFQATPGNARVDQDFTDSGFTWRGYARYTPSPDTSLYAIYARGRRPKVLTAAPPSVPGGPARFLFSDAETVDSYEAGFKTALVNRTLYLDGAIYYYKYDNFQTTEQVGTVFITSNAGKADSYGFETQLRYNPSQNLRFFANYAFNHGRFRSGVYNGNRFRLSPDHTFSAGLTASMDVPGGRVDFTPAVTYQSKVFFDNDNDRPDLQTVARGKIVADTVQDEFQDGFALVSARLGYNFARNHFRIEGFVENLFDKDYIKDAGNTGDSIGMATFIPGEPRTFGVQLTARF